ncbi:DNA mismatch repair endonuclease MutL [uncultured Lactobacillus sp.]|uniref:DNA mismatch repair endonuclease MutL n=1 Tax=uncultured Lactobacillus sp. TaxID=153152 RepID=UPI002614211A|nr:DNA mismatch repair endonuclease MutL [uncultured Lactobacillus sp.]
MAKIHELSENLTNQIAAGEVIERPASVVKELVENAIDAQASRIRVEVLHSGLKQISVQDNGSGIAPDQVDLAFMRHATSKIQDEHDLFNIATLGFRGEALASIAAVAHVEILTSTDGQTATRAAFAGGVKKFQEDAGSAKGTKITVGDIFYNTPARLKYLKSPKTELLKIVDIVNRIALGHPEISLTLASDGKVLLRTPGNGNLKQDVANIYGRKVAEKMLTVENEDPDFTLYGLVSEANLTRSSRNFISILLNGRYIKNYQLSSALLDGYGNKLGGKYPIAVLAIEADPLLVDVNVHPTKEEVRLSKEKELSRLITSAVTDALMDEDEASPLFQLTPFKDKTQLDQLEFNLKPNVVDTRRPDDFQLEASQVAEPEGKTDITNKKETETKETKEKAEKKEDKKEEKTSAPEYVDLNQVREDDQYVLTKTWDQHVKEQTALPPFAGGEEEAGSSVTSKADQLLSHHLPALRLLGQMGGYLLAEHDNDLYLLDQVAARRRLEYDQILASLEKEENYQQGLLEPLVFDFSVYDYQKLKDQLPLLRQLGLEMEDFGQNTLLMHSYPTWLKGEVTVQVRELLDQLLSSRESDGKSLLKLVAAKAAESNVSRRVNLTGAEAADLLLRLQTASDPYRDASGQVAVVRLSQNDLSKLFKKGK